jgi:RimJ/RimL family protein N-acetyltransferase
MDIFGERVLLSKISVADLDLICKIECDKELWYFKEKVESDIDLIRNRYMERITDTKTGRHNDFVISLTVEGTKIPIGLAHIWSRNKHRKSWELGYVILPEYRGQGYGTETARLILKFAFEKLNAHKVVGTCNTHNTSSVKLMENIGMTKEAVFKEELYWQNEWTDQFFYSILEKEYVQQFHVGKLDKLSDN